MSSENIFVSLRLQCLLTFVYGHLINTLLLLLLLLLLFAVYAVYYHISCIGSIILILYLLYQPVA